jgi:hypothetical protein
MTDILPVNLGGRRRRIIVPAGRWYLVNDEKSISNEESEGIIGRRIGRTHGMRYEGKERSNHFSLGPSMNPRSRFFWDSPIIQLSELVQGGVVIRNETLSRNAYIRGRDYLKELGVI